MIKGAWIGFFILLSSSLIGQSTFYDVEQIQEIDICFKQENWAAILDSLKSNNSEGRLIAEVTINGQVYKKAGVRFKGNSSFNSVIKTGNAKLPFNIKLDEVDKSAHYQGYKTLKLANGFRDPSMIREVLAYEIARNYMPAPKANFARVRVNGQYFGLYTNTESINKDFLLDRFEEKRGAFFKCDPDFHAEFLPDCGGEATSNLEYIGNDSICYLSRYERKSKNVTDWNNLIRLTRRLRHQPKKLPEILDIESALKMLAFNNLLVNLDSYTGRLCHNYYLFQDSTGQFQSIIWDMNLAFGGFRYAGMGKVFSKEELIQTPVFMHANSESRPLISHLLKNEEYRNQYLRFYKQVLDEHFVSGVYLKRAEMIQNLISEAYAEDTQKLYGFEQFRQNLKTSTKVGKVEVIGIEELMSKRVSYLLAQPFWLD